MPPTRTRKRWRSPAGAFLAVGSNRDVLDLATARTRKIDLGGKTVVPGFIDAHTHVAYSGLRHLRQVDCDLRSIAEIQAAVRQRAASSAQGSMGGRVQVRRHQDLRGPQAESCRSGRRRARSSGLHRAPRRPHRLRQLAGAADRRRQQQHARPVRRPFRARRRRASDRRRAGDGDRARSAARFPTTTRATTGARPSS